MLVGVGVSLGVEVSVGVYVRVGVGVIDAVLVIVGLGKKFVGFNVGVLGSRNAGGAMVLLVSSAAYKHTPILRAMNKKVSVL